MELIFDILLFDCLVLVSNFFRGEMNDIWELFPHALLLLRFLFHYQVKPLRVLRFYFGGLLHLCEDVHHAVNYFLFSSF